MGNVLVFTEFPFHNVFLASLQDGSWDCKVYVGVFCFQSGCREMDVCGWQSWFPNLANAVASCLPASVAEICGYIDSSLESPCWARDQNYFLTKQCLPVVLLKQSISFHVDVDHLRRYPDGDEKLYLILHFVQIFPHFLGTGATTILVRVVFNHATYSSQEAGFFVFVYFTFGKQLEEGQRLLSGIINKELTRDYSMDICSQIASLLFVFQGIAYFINVLNFHLSFSFSENHYHTSTGFRKF